MPTSAQLTAVDANVGHQLITALTDHGFSAVRGGDRADSYITFNLDDGAVITVSGEAVIDGVLDDVTVDYPPTAHIALLATLRTDAEYRAVYDSDGLGLPFSQDLAHLVAALTAAA